jgi:hypothetical protein
MLLTIKRAAGQFSTLAFAEQQNGVIAAEVFSRSRSRLHHIFRATGITAYIRAVARPEKAGELCRDEDQIYGRRHED